MKTNSNIKTLAVAALVGLGSVAGAANAAVDTTGIITVTADVLAAVGVVGLAVTAIYYGKKAYVWLRPN